MVISSLVGTVIPMLFHKIHIDPAVASGPLITTINDLVAVVVYYGLAAVVLIDLFHLAEIEKGCCRQLPQSRLRRASSLLEGALT